MFDARRDRPHRKAPTVDVGGSRNRAGLPRGGTRLAKFRCKAPVVRRRSQGDTMPATRKPAAARKSASPDAIALLKQDHKDVKNLFKQYEDLVKQDAEQEEKQLIALQICSMLTVHATIEEEIFYPAAREVLKEEDLVDEADVEHATAKDLIAQIESMQPDAALYDAKVKVLGEYIDHHVKEEEEEMFPKCKSGGMDVKEIGAQLKARQEELMTEATETASK
jgi:hemerythrin superfamily protein